MPLTELGYTKNHAILLSNRSIGAPLNTKGKILDSALKLFVSEGFGASTSSITKDVEVSSGILFHYFPTKNDLIVGLYTEIFLEYNQITAQIIKDFRENDPVKHQDIARLSWESLVNWGLDNWQKFQYMQLFESSLLADQFEPRKNKAIEGLYLQYKAIIRSGTEHQYLKDLPVEFLVEITMAVVILLTKYLHENPHYLNDKDFMEKAWQVHWNILAR